MIDRELDEAIEFLRVQFEGMAVPSKAAAYRRRLAVLLDALSSAQAPSVQERGARLLGLGVSYEGRALDPSKVTLHYEGRAPSVRVTDEMVERAAKALEREFQFRGFENTRLPGTEQVDCAAAARAALVAALSSDDGDGAGTARR